MQITKVKYRRQVVEVVAHDEVHERKLTRDMTIKSDQEPRPEFIRSFGRMAKAALDAIGSPDSWKAKAECIGVSFSYDENDGGMGMTATVLVPLDKFGAPLVINTPHLREPRDDQQNVPCLEGELSFAALDVLSEAQLYAKGLRAQLDLDDILSRPLEGEESA